MRKLNITLAVMIMIICMMTNPSSAETTPCPLPNDNNAILDLIWPWVDTNNDGGISLQEISVLYPVPANYFNMFDSNRDGKIDKNEFQPLLTLLSSYLPGGVLSLVDSNGNSLI